MLIGYGLHPVRIGVLLISVALLLPATASARRGTPLPRGPVTVIYAPCPGYPDALGCVTSDQPDTIYVSSHDRGDLEHERGHIFDRRNLDDGERNRIKRMLHKTQMAWCDTETYMALRDQTPENSPPCEDFADAYENCRMGWNPDGDTFDVSYGYNPTRREHRRMCALIGRAAD